MGCCSSKPDVARDVAAIHDVLRVNLTHILVFAEVAGGTTAKSHKYRKMTPEFAKYAMDVFTLTHHHHETEDNEFFPWLLNREGLTADAKKTAKTFIKQLGAEHRVLEKELTACEKYIKIFLGERTALQQESDKRRRERAGPLSEWQYEYQHLLHHINNVITLLFPHLRAEEEFFDAEWFDTYCPGENFKPERKSGKDVYASVGLLRFTLNDEQLDGFGISGCIKCCIIPCCFKEHYYSSAPFLRREVNSKIEQLSLSRDWDVSELSELSKSISLDEGSDYSSGGSDQEKAKGSSGRGGKKGKGSKKKGKKKSDSEESDTEVSEEEESAGSEEDTEEASSS